MSTKRLLLIMLALVIVPLIVFISVYQRYALSAMQRKIAEHTEVIAPALWNYDASANIEYLTLAAQADHYESIVLEDRLGLMQQTLEGMPPTPLERWFIDIKLIPLYTFQEEIRYGDKIIGTLTVIWRCQTVYTTSYVAVCLIFLAAGITLYIRLLGTKQALLVNNRHLEQEIIDRRQAEAALKEAQETLEQRVQDRTRELSESNRLLSREVAERQRAEEALKTNEAQLRTLIKTIPDLIWMKDPDGVFLICNLRFERLFGAQEADIVGKSDVDFVEPALADFFHRHDQAAIAAGKPTMNEERVTFAEDGHVEDLETIKTPVYTSDGELLGVLGIGRDITERKRIAMELEQHRVHLEDLVRKRTEELSQAKEVAEQERQASEDARRMAEDARYKAENANQAKSIFLTNMSHELRTPLNAILGFSQLMAREPSLNDSQRENLSVINRSGEHLLKLINNVLEMSKIEAGHVNLHLDTCDLWQTLQSIEEMVAVRARSKDLQLKVTQASELSHYIRIDESKLRQILVNLLGNAIKFTEQGSVELHVNVRSNGVMEYGNNGKTFPHSNTRTLHFEISDTGSGIAADELESIFETFGRARQNEQAIEGTGLGLAISRKFAHLMGGEITVASEIGKGSVFTFILPVEVVQAPEHFRPHAARRIVGLSPDQPPRRILIVEDTATSRKFLRQLLRSAGFIVDEAGNGQEAIEQWQQQCSDLIFMDMRMPVMDGYEATREIRKCETQNQKLNISNQKSGVPIIALTASAFEEEQTRILEAGCQDVLKKPVQEHIIFETLQSYLGVEYLYAEAESEQEHGKRVEKEHSAPLTPEALQTLPPDILDFLEQAAAQVNVRHVDEAITFVRHHNTSIAEALANLAKDFKYQDIWKIIQQVKR